MRLSGRSVTRWMRGSSRCRWRSRVVKERRSRESRGWEVRKGVLTSEEWCEPVSTLRVVDGGDSSRRRECYTVLTYKSDPHFHECNPRV